MKHHPFTEVLPLLSGKDYDELKASIAANGLRLPVLTYQDQVLDGRNRERACEELGLLVRYEPATATSDAEALDLVVNLNLNRRHLPMIERTIAAEKFATLRNGSNRYRRKILGASSEAPTVEQSMTAAAAKLGTNRSAIQRVRAIRQHGTEQDLDEVRSGKVSLNRKATELRAKIKVTRAPRQNKGKGGGKILYLPAPSAFHALTPQEVNPEFTGSPAEWTAKYGHVQAMTAEQYQTMRFEELAGNWRSMAKCWRELPHSARPIDQNWLRSPKAKDVDKLREALDYLRPLLSEAETLLACAEAALEKRDRKA